MCAAKILYNVVQTNISEFVTNTRTLVNRRRFSWYSIGMRGYWLEFDLWPNDSMFKMITEYEISIQQENLFTDENLYFFPLSKSYITHRWD